MGNFHTAAYFASLGAVTDADVPVISDDILPQTNSHHFPSRDMKLICAYVSGVTLVRAKIVTPKTRQYGFQYIEPVNAALLPATDPAFTSWYDFPFMLNKEEEVAVQATESAVGPNNIYAVIWVADQLEPVAPGDAFWIRVTSSTAAVASAWTTLTSTFDVNLPQGLYDVVGLRHESTNSIAARLIFENQYLRPGVLGGVDSSFKQPWEFRTHKLGRFGSFRTNSLPRIQVLANAADASHVWYMQVIRRGN